jgi:hypothetical protein
LCPVGGVFPQPSSSAPWLRASARRGQDSPHCTRDVPATPPVPHLQNFLDSGGIGLIWGACRCDRPKIWACRSGISLAETPACRWAAGNSGWITRLGRTAMRQNALLRSGKGLGTPGTARKKVPVSSRSGTACAAPECI